MHLPSQPAVKTREVPVRSDQSLRLQKEDQAERPTRRSPWEPVILIDQDANYFRVVNRLGYH